MINKFVALVKNPLSGPLFLFIILFIIPLIVGSFVGDSFYKKIEIALIAFVIIIIFSELLFSFFYRLYHGQKYNFIKKIPFEKITMESHPYLPYILKKKFQSIPSERINYPLHSNFYAPYLRTNNFRYINGPNGDRDIIVPKPQNLYRINCIGGSTTQTCLSSGNKNYSYPMELEKILKSKFSRDIEVNNCGVGGYNSADLLVRFVLQTIDTKPDLVVINHARNDIESYLKPNFSSDYSHSRKNIGEAYWKFLIGSKIPDVPVKFINFLKNKWFPSRDVRNTVLETVSRGNIDPKIDFFPGLKIYERNLQNIINLCLNNNIDVVLCTYPFYLHSKIKNDSIYILYEKIVIEENKIMKKLAEKNNLKLVDSYSLIPKEDSNFVDSVHFTPKGMNLLAKSISEKINI